MHTGLLHGHKAIAYVVCLLALATLGLALSAARRSRGAAAALHSLNRFGVMIPGRLNLLVGAGLWTLRGWALLTPWLVGAVLLWGPVELAWSRFILPELARVRGGGVGSARVVVGTLMQLVAVVAIFALMMVKPT